MSGYSNETKVSFEFDKQGAGYWCGHQGKPLSENQRVRAFRPAT